MEERLEQEKHDEGGHKGNVVKFTRRRMTAPPVLGNAVPVVPQDPVTDQELADYRKYWPLMKRMLHEFEAMKDGKQGCPIMRSILGLDDPT